jgi:hypothetical protein
MLSTKPTVVDCVSGLPLVEFCSAKLHGEVAEFAVVQLYFNKKMTCQVPNA